MEMWGKLTSIDLKKCNLDIITNKQEIEIYINKLCHVINMTKYLDPIIVHFGKDKRVEGYSMMQFIETSSITGHFSNSTRNAYIDIFSCSLYSSNIAAEFSADFFDAEEMYCHVLNRY